MNKQTHAKIDWLTKYLDNQIDELESLPLFEIAKFIERMEKALKEERQVFVFGNGGSAANASHFAVDMGKGASDAVKHARFKIMSLTDNVSWITAIANDYNYQSIFVNQLKNFARPKDVAIGLSVSGNSPNCCEAMGYAKLGGLYTIALTGKRENSMTRIADLSIVVDSTHYGIVEDAHMTIFHMVANHFMDKKEPPPKRGS